MREVTFDFAYMFLYSERPNTFAAKKYKDDVPEELKLKRLQEVIVASAKKFSTKNKKRRSWENSQSF